jgi:hypothetical protein
VDGLRLSPTEDGGVLGEFEAGREVNGLCLLGHLKDTYIEENVEPVHKRRLPPWEWCVLGTGSKAAWFRHVLCGGHIYLRDAPVQDPYSPVPMVTIRNFIFY